MTERKSQPELIRVVWTVIKKLNSDKTYTSLKNVLSLLANEKKITYENLEKELMKAVDDGLIVRTISPPRALFQIPKLQKGDRQRLEKSSDWYCYYCHTSENLINCARCPRVVHKLCASQNDDDTTVGDQPEPNINSANSSNTEANPTANLCIESIDFNGDVCVDDSWLPVIMLKKEPLKTEESDVDETKPVINEDCQFISVLRPPAKRKARDIKNTIVLDVDESSNRAANDLEIREGLNLNQPQEIICQYCKLLSTQDINQEPNISGIELNNLLGFLYERIKPWINFAASPLSKSFSKEFQETYKLFFLKFPVTLDTIKSKLVSNMYKTLDEFYCDILDFHHGVAIIYGTTSKEYYTSQQTLLECTYHISEIRSCHDCYRHSNQLQNQSKYWFTEPCTIRHEPVFAKQVGFPYWPAKVLKVTGDDYDVRFFGSKHTRAIVTAKHIKPIDTSLEELKISKKSTGFFKAMAELDIYQQRRMNNFNDDYSNISHNNINFQLDATTISNYNTSQGVLDTNIGGSSINVSPAPKPSEKLKFNFTKANLRSRTKNMKYKQESGVKSTNGQILIKDRSPPLLVLKTHNSSDNTNSIKSININKNCKETMDNIRTALNAIPMEIETRKQMLRSVEVEVKNLTEDFKSLLRQVKKGEWCYVCGKIGKYYCCYSTFYCSSDCQHKHWNEEHASKCRKIIETDESV